VTARWVVDEVRPARDLEITWQPISLKFKNNPEPDSPYYSRVGRTHDLLRVLESVRTTGGSAAVEALYWEFGRRIHHDGEVYFDPADALSAVGLDTSHAAALEDLAWDDEIRTRMDLGLALAGNDIGTPIIGFDNVAGERVGLFGPVITSVPSHELSLQLWDGLVAVATVPGFWELKRTRTQSPEFGERP
jgi:hypothetical protein